MLKFIATIFDRILFTLSFIIGVQLPEFIQQYSQRLSGHLNEALNHLAQFQFIASTQYQGNLATLIEQYRQNADPAIQQTGEIVNTLIQRTELLSNNVSRLQDNQFANRVYYFFKELDIKIAQATFDQFIMAIPIEVYALSTGAIFAFMVVFTKSGLWFGTKQSCLFVYSKCKNNFKSSNSAAS